MGKVTIREVAARAKVSPTAVSMVLHGKKGHVSEEAWQRVLIACKELDYVPNHIAQSLVTKHSRIIALLFPDTYNPSNPFYMEISSTINEVASRRGYLVMHLSMKGERREDSFRPIFQGNLCEGVIIISHRLKPGDKLLDPFFSHMKIVLLDDPMFKINRGEILVSGDNEGGGYLAAKTLIEQGHRRLACVKGNDYAANSKRRWEGFLRACKEFGIAEDEIVVHRGNYKYEESFVAGTKIAHTPCTGVFCFNDLSAYGCIKGLQQEGKRVPSDVSVIGYDNLSMTKYLDPELTTIDQQSSLIAETACNAIIDMIEGLPISKDDCYIEPLLIPRNTVKARIG